jgi:hypothetical protein
MERPKRPYSIHSRPTNKRNRRIYYSSGSRPSLGVQPVEMALAVFTAIARWNLFS